MKNTEDIKTGISWEIFGKPKDLKIAYDVYLLTAKMKRIYEKLPRLINKRKECWTIYKR